MSTVLIKNIKVVNEGKSYFSDIYIKNERIEKVDSIIDKAAKNEIDGTGKILIPGVIDDQVHFREPGMSYKASVFTESRAALAGGVTSFMDMPNTKPATLTQELLQKRYDHAAVNSAINYSFYMGASNDNLGEVLKTRSEDVCGVKIFMGSSTGNMLVDDPKVLDSVFANSSMLIATHCEDETTIRNNTNRYIEKYGDQLTANYHPEIRSAEACFLSSSFAIGLAKKHGSRLHVLHLTSAGEMDLFEGNTPLNEKRITAEVCVHHLFFDSEQYSSLGNRIKCNPAIKSSVDREALWTALHQDKLDVIATDHAPHTLEEKQRKYIEAPSGLPLVQHSLTTMMELSREGKISIEKVVEKMCHAPAIAFKIRERGFIREGYFADMAIINTDDVWTVTKDNIRYKCAWSPLEGYEFNNKIEYTFVNGKIAFQDNKIMEVDTAKRLLFYS